MADVALGRMGQDPSFEQSIPNAVMASRPKQEFWLLVMLLMVRDAGKSVRPEYITGPIILKRAVDMCLRNPYRTRLATAAIRSQLRKDQQPDLSTSTIAILNNREWYPIDWSSGEGQALRIRVFDCSVLNAQEKADLLPGSTLVTYWAHSWE